MRLTKTIRKTRAQNAKNKARSKNKLLTKRFIAFAVSIVIIGGAVFRIIYIKQNELTFPVLSPPASDALYKNPSQPIEARVKDLLERMSLEEKIGQMALIDKRSLSKPQDIKDFGLGGILSGAGAKPSTNDPQNWYRMVAEMKKQSKESRLGIPIFYGIDANHGHSNVLGATIFPHSIGLGASGDAELVNKIAEATASEIKATGINWNYSPSLDAPKDIRWGRVYEAYSDDPGLNSKLGVAYINGTQGPGQSYILASAKHYLGTGSMVWGESNHKKFKIDQGKILNDEHALNNYYLPPYKAAVDAGVGSIMVGLSEWGDTRIIDNKYLITDKLKTELGFKGFVVSDWYGAYEYSGTSKYRANINTINAGLDMAMLPYEYKAFIKDVRKAVQKNEISQGRIDDAVSRILYQKFRAGLFDEKEQDPDIKIVGSIAHRQLARQAVSSSTVLLKNNEVLPLSKTNGEILIAGSGADNVGRQSGAWTVEWQGIDGNWVPGATSILQGIRQTVGNSGVQIHYNKDGAFNDRKKKADVGIAIVSEKPYAEGWGDNPSPRIDKADLETIRRLKLSSNKVIVIIISGRPLFINDEIKSWDAAVAAWLPGSEGAGIADVLFRDKSFSATLPLPWPAIESQLPINHDGATKDQSRPLFPRGYGLTTN
jgi:beta-glucosidase